MAGASTVAPNETTGQKKARKPIEGSHDCSVCSQDGTKCDRQRPYCSQCLQKGRKTCPGYATALAWDNGIASRGLRAGWIDPVTPSTKKERNASVNNNEFVAPKRVVPFQDPNYRATINKTKTTWPGVSKPAETMSPQDTKPQPQTEPLPELHASTGPADDIQPLDSSVSRKRSRTETSSTMSYRLQHVLPTPQHSYPTAQLPQASQVSIWQAPPGQRPHRLWIPQHHTMVPSSHANYAHDTVGQAFAKPSSGQFLSCSLPANLGLNNEFAQPTSCIFAPPNPHMVPMSQPTHNAYMSPIDHMQVDQQLSPPMFSPQTVNRPCSSPLAVEPPLVSPIAQLEKKVSQPTITKKKGPRTRSTQSRDAKHKLNMTAVYSDLAEPHNGRGSGSFAENTARLDQQGICIQSADDRSSTPWSPVDQPAEFDQIWPNALSFGEPEMSRRSPDPATQLFAGGESGADYLDTAPASQQALDYRTAVQGQLVPRSLPSWPVDHFANREWYPSETGDMSLVGQDHFHTNWIHTQTDLLGSTISETMDLGSHQDIEFDADLAMTESLVSGAMEHERQDEFEMQQLWTIEPDYMDWPSDRVTDVKTEPEEIHDRAAKSQTCQVKSQQHTDFGPPTGLDGFDFIRNTSMIGWSCQARGVTLPFLLDYYCHKICPYIVAGDDLTKPYSNPYRYFVYGMIYQSEVLQYAMGALTVNNIRRRKEHTPGYATELLSGGNLEGVEKDLQHRCITRMQATLSDDAADPNQKSGCLMAMTLLCLHSICDSAHSNFAKKTENFRKALSTLWVKTPKTTYFMSFNMSFWMWFDVMTSAINCRQVRILARGLDWNNLRTHLGPLEEFAGCDGRILKAIAKLGHLTQLSQGRHFTEEDYRVHLTRKGKQRQAGSEGDQPPQNPVQASLRRFMHKPKAMSLNNFREMMSLDIYQQPSVLRSFSRLPNSGEYSDAADNRKEFWSEFREVHDMLEKWEAKTPRSMVPPGEYGHWDDMQYSNQAFRYAAQLILARLEHPCSVSRKEPFKTIVRNGMHAIDNLVKAPHHKSENNPQLKFLLFPLFILGTEAVLQEDRDVIRKLCQDIYLESGFINNIAIIPILEDIWSHHTTDERHDSDETDARKHNCAASQYDRDGVWEYGIPLTWYKYLQQEQEGEWIII